MPCIDHDSLATERTSADAHTTSLDPDIDLIDVGETLHAEDGPHHAHFVPARQHRPDARAGQESMLRRNLPRSSVIRRSPEAGSVR